MYLGSKFESCSGFLELYKGQFRKAGCITFYKVRDESIWQLRIDLVPWSLREQSSMLSFNYLHLGFLSHIYSLARHGPESPLLDHFTARFYHGQHKITCKIYTRTRHQYETISTSQRYREEEIRIGDGREAHDETRVQRVHNTGHVPGSGSMRSSRLEDAGGADLRCMGGWNEARLESLPNSWLRKGPRH